MIAYIELLTDEGYRAMVRADDFGTYYESVVYPKAPPGRPPAGGREEKAIKVVTILCRNGTKLHARNQTYESIRNMLVQALGQQIHIVSEPVYEGRDAKPEAA